MARLILRYMEVDFTMICFAKGFIVAVTALVFSTKITASCEIDISDYVGWTIVYSGTVTGYVDEHGQEQDDFEGCDYGRVLIVDYTKAVICAEYSYSYAYHPDIVVISDGRSMEACIDDDMYDIRK